MNKNIIIQIGVLFIILEQTFAIQCYFCTVAPKYTTANSTQKLCTNFSESNEFVTDCPYSTMCVKTIYKYKLLDGKTVETVSRGCANQKSTEMKFEDKVWHDVNTIEEIFEEGCGTFNKIEPMTYCRCRGHLCNSAPKQDTSNYHTDAMAVIFVFNAMKYLRNMD